MWKKIFPYLGFLASFLAKGGIAAGGLYILISTGSATLLPVSLLTGGFLLISLIFPFFEHRCTQPWKYAYIFVQACLVTLVVIIEPNMNFMLIWYYVLCVEAISMLPKNGGYLAIAVFAALTVVVILATQDPSIAYILMAIYLGGFFFFATFARSTAVAQEAQQESQRLLGELQTTHRKLQEYAIQAEQLAVAEERNRLAREMHDTLGHRLTVSAVQLEGAGRLIATDPDRAREMVGTVRDQVREALSELRRSVATLREPLEADIPIDISIQRLVASFEQATGLQTNLMLPERLPTLDNHQRLAVYRTAQEALTNIHRHAEARQAWIQIACQPGQMILRVSDDGIGLPEESPASGFGLRGIQERADQLGGGFNIEPRPGGGTTLVFQIPVEACRD